MMSASELAKRIEGDVVNDPETRKRYSRDTSVFERMPRAVVFPKNAADVAEVVKYAYAEKMKGGDISVAARSAGTDMTGGPLTSGISLVFTKYMNKIFSLSASQVTAEPGIYYRDLEKKTLELGSIIPSYPASRELCALGGMVANNSGGELTLRYGKTNRYVRSLDVVLSDGSESTFRPLAAHELAQKMALKTFEGDIYRKMQALISKNRGVIRAARPHVPKNSAGYALWDVEDESAGTFDLSQLVVGSQGTLAIVTKASVALVKPKDHRAMLVVFLSDIKILPEIVHRVLRHEPESFESYDDHTLRLAVRFFPQIIHHVGVKRLFGFAASFLREAWMVLTGGVPKFVLMAEFAEDTPEAAERKARAARAALTDLAAISRVSKNEASSAKYWAIRRESFALLRKNLKGLYAAPFIDDIVVDPDTYPRFLPALQDVLDEHKLIYTIAGHVGDGNFHIIPLLNLGTPEARREILELTPKVYRLVAEFKGSITGEHNDGIIRTPFLPLMYGDAVCALFAEVKKIFDPLDILNPGKKVGGTIADIKSSMITHI